jgi:GT2 family glycosyltransferase
MLDVSIIVVNWNGRDLLRKCIDAVQQTVKKVSYEIVARANNQAMQGNDARYILLLNSDAFVKENAVDEMVAFMDARPEAGMAGCKLLYEDGRLQPSCTAFPTLMTELFIALRLDKLFPKSKLFGKYLMTYWDFNDVREVDAIMGAFMLVRNSAIQKIGMLDESYFMYSEEVDWCFRFKEAGWKIYYNPAVETTHLWFGSAKKVRVEMHIQMYRSKVMFFRKRYGDLSANILKLFVGLNCLVRLGPGAVYYLRKDSEKYQAVWKLFRALPAF